MSDTSTVDGWNLSACPHPGIAILENNRQYQKTWYIPLGMIVTAVYVPTANKEAHL